MLNSLKFSKLIFLAGIIANISAVNHKELPKNSWIASQTKDLSKRFGPLAFNGDYNVSGVRSHETFVPSFCNRYDKPILLVLVHGTFAQDGAAYYQNEHPFFQYVKSYAQDLAVKAQAPVELISFRWKGSNNSHSRKNGGVSLASIINNHFGGYQVVTVAHSHGCNLVNFASSLVAKDIDHIINIAAPVRESSEADFKPVKFKKLTQFYSSSDMVAAVGSISEAYKPWLMLGNIRKFGYQNGKKVYNVRTQINGTDPGHSNIKGVVIYLSDILEKIDSFCCNCDLDLNLRIGLNQGRYFKCDAEDVEDIILTSVRHYINQKDIAEFKQLTMEDQIAIAQQLATEYSYSEEQKKKFKKLYNKDMEEKLGFFGRLRQAWSQETVNYL